MRTIAILGSTGSIGVQTLEVVELFPEKFTVDVLTAHRQADLLIAQALKFRPAHVVIVEESEYEKVKNALSGTGISVACGSEALCDAMDRTGIDVVVGALVGFAGLKPAIRAIRNGITLALANKETLVVAGEIMTGLAREHNVALLPVDSEHSAIFQCLVGEDQCPVEKIVLTASGGPFRGYTYERLREVTPAQALKHPNWDMGAKITIDSASMMNKGLEVIEAKWLFGLTPDQIEVIVHPQSIVHSLVQFQDGSMKAQLGLPDMRLPIQYALSYPGRWQNPFPRFDFLNYPSLTFEQVDRQVFRNLGLAFEAMEMGGNAPCILNAANEETNLLFRQGVIRFTEIGEWNEAVLSRLPHLTHPSLDDLYESDRLARLAVQEQAGVKK